MVYLKFLFEKSKILRIALVKKGKNQSKSKLIHKLIILSIPSSGHFKFGSWTYDGNKLNLHFLNSTGPNIDLREYVNSSEWDMISCEAKRSIRYYPCCGKYCTISVFYLKF